MVRSAYCVNGRTDIIPTYILWFVGTFYSSAIREKILFFHVAPLCKNKINIKRDSSHITYTGSHRVPKSTRTALNFDTSITTADRDKDFLNHGQSVAKSRRWWSFVNPPSLSKNLSTKS